MRRGRPLTSQTAFGGQLPYKGSLVRPAARFGHSQSEYNGKFLRATNNEPLFFDEPRVTRVDVVNLSLSPRMSLGMYTGFTRDALWASPTETACDRRGRQAPYSMNDERPTMNGFLGPNVLFAKYFSCYSWGNCVQ